VYLLLAGQAILVRRWDVGWGGGKCVNKDVGSSVLVIPICRVRGIAVTCRSRRQVWKETHSELDTVAGAGEADDASLERSLELL
jgi:hypothetical protein